MDPVTLLSDRLLIRPFVMDDLEAIHRILDQTLGAGEGVEPPATLEERRSWLQWSVLSQEWLPEMDQPPYGDRAITLRSDGAIIGAIGYVPLLEPFDQIPELRSGPLASPYATPEVGLFWAVDRAHQRQGFATEAARVMIDHAFTHLRIKRILATTEYGNEASLAVMRKVGMTITRNPLEDPPWLQIVGVLDNPGQ